MRKILVFVNPRARNGADSIGLVKEWAKKHGIEALNEGSTDIHKDIREHSSADAIVVGGGDGSVNAVLPSLLKSKIPLLLLPLGTANNLARTLNIPSEPEKALDLLLQGNTSEIDIGLANDIPFVNVIGLGLSTQVNRLSRSSLKRIFGVFAFIWTAFKVGLRMKPFRIFVDCDGQEHSAKTWQVTVCNGRNYGSGLTIHKEATLRDETLHGLSTEVKKWWHAFTLVPALMTGKFRAEHDVSCFQGKIIKLRTHRPMSVDVDGDIKTHTPLEVKVAPKALRIFVPSKATNPPAP